MAYRDGYHHHHATITIQYLVQQHTNLTRNGDMGIEKDFLIDNVGVSVKSVRWLPVHFNLTRPLEGLGAHI